MGIFSFALPRDPRAPVVDSTLIFKPKTLIITCCIVHRQRSLAPWHRLPSVASDFNTHAVWRSATCGRRAVSTPLGKVLRKRQAVDKHLHFLHGRELQRRLFDLRLHKGVVAHTASDQPAREAEPGNAAAGVYRL